MQKIGKCSSSSFKSTLLVLAILMMGLCQRSMAIDTEVISISNGWDLSQWEEKEFSNITEYSTVETKSTRILKASTDNSASILFKQIDIDLEKTPYLNWSWKVENIYPIVDQQTKEGDDFPARIYVILREGALPWQAFSLNYVWSNTSQDESFWRNPFTPKAIMIPVQSGDEKLGQWQHYKKNIREDFLSTLNKNISKIHGIAVMADSDNSMGKAISYFGNISFSAE